MRLSDEHRTTIRDLTREIVGDQARVLLFGSRLDDRQRGGDVDLLVESPLPLASRLTTGTKVVSGSSSTSTLRYGACRGCRAAASAHVPRRQPGGCRLLLYFAAAATRHPRQPTVMA